MTSPALKSAGGPKMVWTREKVLEALERYTELYGPDWTAAAFSPAAAKWRDEPEMAERYVQGDPETGAPWPSLNVIKSRFDGSLNGAREALGLEPNKPGPRKRRADHAHAPVRDMRHVTRTVTVYRDSDRVEILERKIERLERKLAEKPKVKEVKSNVIATPKTKIVREKVVDTRALDRANRTIARLEAETSDSQERLADSAVRISEALSSATRAASKLERAEATINGLREDRRQLKSQVNKLEDRLTVAQRKVAELEAREPVVITEEAPEKAVVDAANSRADEAETRAARAERQLMETVALVKGEKRRLTEAEIAELRHAGPAGEPLVADALRALAQARQTSEKVKLRAALRQLASAAVTWSERL